MDSAGWRPRVLKWMDDEGLQPRVRSRPTGQVLGATAWDVPIEVREGPKGLYLVLDAELQPDDDLLEMLNRADEDRQFQIRNETQLEALRAGCDLKFEPPMLALATVVYLEGLTRATFMERIRVLHRATWLVALRLRVLEVELPAVEDAPPSQDHESGTQSHLASLLRAEVGLDELPSSPDAEVANACAKQLEALTDLTAAITARLRQVATDDPSVRAVGRGIGTAVEMHLGGLKSLADQKLWVPALCGLRGYLEACVAAVTFHGNPRRTYDQAVAATRISVYKRMKAAGVAHAHDAIYGPLSNVAHNGYSAIACQQKSDEVPMDEVASHLDRGNEAMAVVPFLVSPSGERFPLPGRFALVDGPLPDALARAMYMPLLATVATDAACWTAERIGVARKVRKPHQKWLATSGDGLLVAFRRPQADDE